ncbi:transcriptional regulator, LuxR family domain protein [gut metagenome]|uniref:Transcriptional regulator, LuxR family domain protein n=1 Tax=gut metagenome TaxID=749906 RepID=J9FMI0_9ZZZZ
MDIPFRKRYKKSPALDEAGDFCVQGEGSAFRFPHSAFRIPLAPARSLSQARSVGSAGRKGASTHKWVGWGCFHVCAFAYLCSGERKTINGKLKIRNRKLETANGKQAYNRKELRMNRTMNAILNRTSTSESTSASTPESTSTSTSASTSTFASGRGAYVPTDPMMNIVRDNYSLLQVVSRFGLSLGFGDQSVQAVCRASGVDTATFLAVVNLLNRPEATDACHPDFGLARETKEEVVALRLPTLLQYLRQSHAYFLDFCLPGIRRQLMEAIDCSMQNEVAFLLLKFFDQYMNEVRKHMHYEDTQVFPYVEQLLEAASGEPAALGAPDNSASVPSAGDGAPETAGRASSVVSIRQFATHHDQIDAKLSELKNLLIQYYPASGNNYRLNAVLLDLYSCEQELAAHTRVEDHLFVPAVYRLECPDAVFRTECSDAAFRMGQSEAAFRMGQASDACGQESPEAGSSRAAGRSASGSSASGSSELGSSASGSSASVGSSGLETGVEVLTDREKEIVCCVAKGMINKEIAEALFLSIHTVTTHRKNIARKLQIHSVAGLAIYAIAHKLVELSEVKL